MPISDRLGALISSSIKVSVPAQLLSLGLALSPDDVKRVATGQPPSDAITQFQKLFGMQATGALDADTIAAIEKILSASTYAVAGTVRGPRGGVAGVTVELLDKRLGGDAVLAKTVTAAPHGHYSAVVTVPPLVTAAKDSLDLQARASLNGAVIGSSGVHYNASHNETIDIALAASTQGLPGEYETLLAAIASQYTGSLASLQETAARKDITYLATKAKWDARAVAMASLAAKFSADLAQGPLKANLDSAFYYALFRAGVPANADAIAQLDPNTAQTIWKNAFDSGLLPAKLAPTLAAATRTFQAVATAGTLAARAVSGGSTLNDLLKISLGSDAAAAQKFATLQTQFRNDSAGLWKAVTAELGADKAASLKIDGQLAYLTMHNAGLIDRLHKQTGTSPIAAPLDLVQRGLFRPEAWAPLLNAQIPDAIPGATAKEKSANYAGMLAAQVQLSYPTAVLGARIGAGEIALAAPVRAEVQTFLSKNQGAFEIGVEPINRYIARNGLEKSLSAPATSALKSLQRVYQITPNDMAMNALLTDGLDSAHKIAQWDQKAFVAHYSAALGADTAQLTYRKAQHVHDTLQNVAASYIAARRMPSLGMNRNEPILGPPQTPAANSPMKAAATGSDSGTGGVTGGGATPDVIAYPTLETLFNTMDYCSCEECRSILSPAAYLVDLLLFLDVQPLPSGANNPQAVLFDRRPDIQYLPLTCENTNTALPQIDLVIEILEQYVFNNSGTLSGYRGHDTDGRTPSAELLATPQFVIAPVYDTLKSDQFPPPLPFHKWLENLRLCFDNFGAPLATVMETLRIGDGAWSDILRGYLKLSGGEYTILTDTNPSLNAVFGFASATPPTSVLADLTNVKKFTRRIGISYEDAVALLRTKFVNPASALVPQLELLKLPFSALKTLHDTNTADVNTAFDQSLPSGLDPLVFGGDIKVWVRANYDKLKTLIAISNPTQPNNLCDPDKLEFHYCDPTLATAALPPFEFVRLLRFIRLWKKLGWTIEQTDQALSALYPPAQIPTGTTAMAMLGAGCATMLPRLGSLVRIMGALQLAPGRDLAALLACWSPIGTHGDTALFHQMFLSAALTGQDAAFAPDSAGTVFTGPAFLLKPFLLQHVETLRAAFNLTADELARIVTALGYGATTPLALDTVSAVFRHGWLARKLSLSVAEFEGLIAATGLIPFPLSPSPHPLDPPNPPVFKLLTLRAAMQAAGIAPADALYAIWDIDITQNAAPSEAEISGLARALRLGCGQVESDFAISGPVTAELARARIGLVYGTDTTDEYFSLLTATAVFDTFYTQSSDILDPTLVAAGGTTAAPAPRLSYDPFRKRLSFLGVMSVTTKSALDAASTALPALQPGLATAILALSKGADPFFANRPELRPPFDDYTNPSSLNYQNLEALLTALLPSLKTQRKRQQALVALIAASGADNTLAEAVTGDAGVLHATANPAQPVIEDFLPLETGGLTARFYWSSTVGTTPNLLVANVTTVAYSPATGAAHLPPNGNSAGQRISVLLSGYLEMPESGFGQIQVEADAGAAISLTLDGQPVPLLPPNNNVWNNQQPLPLSAGAMIRFELRAENVLNTLALRWETPLRGREIIPSRWLYPQSAVAVLRAAYARTTKLAALAGALKLSANEISYFAKRSEYGTWANSLPVAGAPAPPPMLTTVLTALVDYARIKATLSPAGDNLLLALQALPSGTAGARDPLLALTRWSADSLNALMLRFGNLTETGLASMAAFARVYDAMALTGKLGISAAALIAAANNDPSEQVIADLQSALRARYDRAAWLDVIKPINDKMRMRQRDALVAHILQANAVQTSPSPVDTPDKLYEYFLIDVEMEPCMQTSRIQSAIAAVQLFIDRCQMNLETKIKPSLIDTDWWSWMNRYRVWQALREVFCFPENFLLSEIRDDQSPIFKETIGELLQSDITEDAAEVALLNYLSKLEEIAKLEPCAIHYVENKPGMADDVAHVVARTSGSHRKYFYRRCAYGSWTPWEQVKLDIEDNPVLPVIWRGRLLLFWLRLVHKMPDSGRLKIASPSGTSDAAGAAMNSAQNAARDNADTFTKASVHAVLCWSEYYNGKWQPTKTSDAAAPAWIGDFVPSGAGAFDRSQLRLASHVDGAALNIVVNSVSQNVDAYARFALYNTHSLPLRGADWPKVSLPFNQLSFFMPPYRTIGTYGDKLSIYYGTGLLGAQSLNGSVDPNNRDLLHNAFPDDIVYPMQDLSAPWVTPFFYGDVRYTFYVTTLSEQITYSIYDSYGFVPSVAGAPYTPSVLTYDGNAQFASGVAMTNFLSGATPFAVGDLLVGATGSSTTTQQAAG